RAFHVTGVQTCALPIYLHADAVDRTGFLVKAIVRDLVLNEQADGKTRREPNRETEDVNQGIASMTTHAACSGNNVMSQHGCCERFVPEKRALNRTRIITCGYPWISIEVKYSRLLQSTLLGA